MINDLRLGSISVVVASLIGVIVENSLFGYRFYYYPDLIDCACSLFFMATMIYGITGLSRES